MTALELNGLPLPPSLNNAYSSNRNGRRFLTEEGRAYKHTTALLARAAAAAAGFSLPDKTPIRLLIIFWFARNNRDGSNAVKLLEDALSEALGVNDLYVYEMTWVKRIDKIDPRCNVVVEAL